MPATTDRRPPPTTERPDGPPAPRGTLVELAALGQLGRLLARAPGLRRAPRGDGRVVVDVPGWRAPEASMAPLRGYLRWLGHDARGWGMGTNEGEPERDAERLAGLVTATAERVGRRVSLVGWSLGGVVAREVARSTPEHVERVVTFGTPVIGGPTHTLAARAWPAAERRRIAQLLERQDLVDPIRVPVTAVYSRRDTVVNWLSCLDHTSPAADHVEVRSTHLGLGLDPDVWLAVARALAAGPPADAA